MNNPVYCYMFRHCRVTISEFITNALLSYILFFYITKGSSNKTKFSNSSGEIRDQNSLNPKTNSGAIGSWQN
jgi:hypothetical protein